MIILDKDEKGWYWISFIFYKLQFPIFGTKYYCDEENSYLAYKAALSEENLRKNTLFSMEKSFL